MADGTLVIGALGWALLDFLWQGLLVGALAALALHALRNSRPQARYAVACIALAACLALPLAGLLEEVAFVDADAAAARGEVSSAIAFEIPHAVALPATGGDWRESLQAQMPAIVAAWSAGALLLALRLLLGCRWVGRLRSRARLPNSFWQGRFDELAVRVGLRAPVPLRLSDTIESPVAAGWWRPVVLVPAALVASLPVELLEALLAHELAHVRRRDYLVNLLQGAVETLLFYHPVVWWLSRRVRIEREQIADDLACDALAEPRQLALALQALDRFQQSRREERQVLAHAHLLPAAHGGQLMPRIKRLLRPDHQRPDWKLALPIAGLAALGLAVHAAQAVTPAVPAIAAVPAVAPVAFVAATPAVAAAPAVAPVAAVAATPRVAATPAVAPVAAAAAVSGIHTGGTREPYAMVRDGEDGMTLSGDLDDMNEVKLAKQHLHGDFLWFRRNGVGYVVQDAALLARARRAWDPAEEIGKKMEALSDQMKPHSARMEALGKQMEAYGTKGEPYSQQMEALGRQMEPLARQQSELGEKMRKLSMTAADAQAHEADMQRLQVQMDGLSGKMEALSRQMEKQGELMREAHAPMEELGKKMQEASAPMEALGKQMEPLGKQIEVLSKKADAEVVQVIDQAVREGKAVPARQLSR
jgi:beta-lactamase regulating signal transducer with metallopeptidase domain/predicted  nucleic acid-binding Zn-ribbon protein